MPAFDNQLRCTIGGTSFQLEDYRASVSPVVKSGIGRTGVNVTVAGSGWVEGDSGAFVAKLADARGKLVISGQDFTIWGLGGEIEFKLLASQCIDGGPHVGFTQRNGLDGSPLLRAFDFDLSTTQSGGDFGGAGTSTNGYSERVAVKADGLRVVTRTGEFTGSSAASTFFTQILPLFKSLYGPPAFIVTYEYQIDQSGLNLRYTLIAVELRETLPLSPVKVVDGTGTYRVERDEQMRLITSWDFDLLLVDGDYQPIIDLIRSPIAANGTITRERVQVTRYAQTRVIATFEVLTGGDGTKLMDWHREFEFIDDQRVWDLTDLPGTDPVKVSTGGFRTLIDSGYAVGCGAWLKAPEPLYPDNLLEPARAKYTYASATDFVTTWYYAYFALKGDNLDTQLTIRNALRPLNPEFYTASVG